MKSIRIMSKKGRERREKKTHYVDLTGQDYDNGRSEGGEAIVKAV